MLLNMLTGTHISTTIALLESEQQQTCLHTGRKEPNYSGICSRVLVGLCNMTKSCYSEPGVFFHRGVRGNVGKLVLN